MGGGRENDLPWCRYVGLHAFLLFIRLPRSSVLRTALLKDNIKHDK